MTFEKKAKEEDFKDVDGKIDPATSGRTWPRAKEEDFEGGKAAEKWFQELARVIFGKDSEGGIRFCWIDQS